MMNFLWLVAAKLSTAKSANR